ncbi:hypothetical protein [Erythrobacter sp. EC-HK427]|uniref:hypothetical protein n=1 Tax=Erythrobacter sp. EC-HK427 TaxID=2038396 RepID=UPI00125F1CD1|nr:hypothetical protein [Erythrobacter sp. EC-HK427]
MRNFRCAALAAASLVFAAIPASAQSSIEELRPVTNWNLDYAEDSCGLSRNFGSADAPVTLLMRQYAPGAPLALTVVGRRTMRANLDAEVHFGPGDNGNARLMTAIELQLENGLNGVQAQTYAPSDNPVGADASAQWIAVSGVFDGDIRLETGSLQPAFNALEECQYSLLEYWGLDAEAHRSLQQRANMRTGDEWVGTALLRMPDSAANAARNSTQWMLFFVGADGDITACRALSPNTFEQFATHFCAMAVERGSAIPAVSAQGEAIASVLSFGLDVRTSAEPFYTDN